jgi:hypothetical protein
MSFWLSEESPIVNGIMFADGSIQSIEPCDLPRSPGTIQLVAGEQANLCLFAHLEPTGLIPLCRVEDKRKGIVVIGGEGGMGSDGFVAFTNSQNQILWMAFFEFSNPFVSVELRDEEIVAVNNLNEKWYFQVENPSMIRIENPRRGTGGGRLR